MENLWKSDVKPDHGFFIQLSSSPSILSLETGEKSGDLRLGPSNPSSTRKDKEHDHSEIFLSIWPKPHLAKIISFRFRTGLLSCLCRARAPRGAGSNCGGAAAVNSIRPGRASPAARPVGLGRFRARSGGAGCLSARPRGVEHPGALGGRVPRFCSLQQRRHPCAPFREKTGEAPEQIQRRPQAHRSV